MAMWVMALALAGEPAVPVEPAAKAFGAREAVQQISLSPDGKHVVIIVPALDRGAVIAVADLVKGGDPRLILSTRGDQQAESCQWSTDTRLICTIRLSEEGDASKRIGFTRVIAVNSDGSSLQALTARPTSRSIGYLQDGGEVIDLLGDAKDGAVLMTRQFLPEIETGTIVRNGGGGLGVERVDTVKLTRNVLERPKPSAVEYITDGHGAVRVMGTQSEASGGFAGNTISYSYRQATGNTWQALSKFAVLDRTGFNPFAVDRDLNVAYGFDIIEGRRALIRVALDGSLKREVVLARPDVDVDHLITVGRQHRVVGVSYATDRRQTAFFDPELAKLRSSLAKALPSLPLISFVDASADESKLLLFAGSDVDPGRYYVYDKASRHLAEVLAVRPELAKYQLAPVSAITFKAADGTDIPAYLTLPVGSNGRGLPAIVLPHGGPGYRDEWGFDWLSQFFAARGFAVLQPNFRGSTGYGDAWFQKNGFQSWQTAIGDVNDAGRYIIKAGIAAPGKLAILGWSYGGYAALQSAVLDPDLFKAIVAIAPVTDLPMLREESRDFTNYRIVDQYIGTGPHLRAGSPAQNVEAFKAPVLLFHGAQDTNVGIGESRTMASRLQRAGKQVTLVEYKGLDHQLDDAAVRAEMLAKIDAYLRAALGL